MTSRPGRRSLLWVVSGLLGAAVLVIAVVLMWPAPQEPTREGPGGAVISLFAAYRSGSCTDFVVSTTQRHREDPYVDVHDCADFASYAAEVAAQGGFSVEITGEVLVGDRSAQVEALETYRAGTAAEYQRVMVYRVLLVDGAWVVDHFDLAVIPDRGPVD